MIRMPTPVGETDETVTFARADVTALSEAIEDAEAQAAFVVTRGEEALPAEVVRRLCAGEHPLRVFREYRGLGIAELGRRAEIASDEISAIEGGGEAVSASTLRMLAAALRVEVDDLVP